MNMAFYGNNALHDSWIVLNYNFYLFEGLGKNNFESIHLKIDKKVFW